jgi:hypothetical protein
LAVLLSLYLISFSTNFLQVSFSFIS